MRSLSGFLATKSSTRDWSVGLCFVARTVARHTGQVYFATIGAALDDATGALAALLLNDWNHALAQEPQFVCKQSRNVTGSYRRSVQISRAS